MDKDLYQQILEYVPYDEAESKDKEVILRFMKNHDDVFTRDNEIAHFTTSAWLVNKERNKVLMIYHNIYKSWAWVGGHADGEKDLKKVIKKEIEEETGIKSAKFLKEEIYGLNIITVDNHIKRGKYVNSHLHFDIEYLLEADERDYIRIKEDENSGIQWVNFENVCECSTEENMKPIYKRLIDKLKDVEQL